MEHPAERVAFCVENSELLNKSYGMNASRGTVYALSLGVANRHLFCVNTLHATQIFGLGTQAKNRYEAAQSISAIVAKNPSIRILFNFHF